jgi:hypothetical protein
MRRGEGMPSLLDTSSGRDGGFISMSTAVPWLRRLVSGLSLRGVGVSSRPVAVRFVVDEVALGQVLLRVLRFSLVITIPPGLLTKSITDAIQS